MKRFFLIVLLFICAMGPASAAGIDCSQAESPLEHAICDDETLLARDALLSVAYETAIGGLSDEALASMRDGQRQWLDYVARACTEDAEPMTSGRYDEDGISCLQDKYRRRIEILEGSRLLGGLRFYLEDRYAAAVDPDAEPDSYWRIANKAFSAVRIDGDNEEARNFNRWRDTEVDAMLASLGLSEGSSPDEVDTGSDVDTILRVLDVSPALITLQVQDYFYPHGAAHGTGGLAMLHYVRDEARSLQASDIFVGVDWQERLGTLAFNALQKQLGEYLMVESADEIRESVIDPARWTCTQSALVIRFLPYEVTAYAFGMPEVSLPWDQFKTHLSENAANLTGGYWVE